MFSVADAFELTVELSGGIVGIARFVFSLGFDLALFEGVVKIGLGEGMEGEKGEAEGRRGRVEASIVRIGSFFSAVLETLEKENGSEDDERG
jgi:hypothetical protein